MTSSFKLINGAQVIYKSPEANLDYTIDWTAWLDAGETISTSSWSAETGVTLVANTHGTATTQTFIAGGTVGMDYRVTNTITTSAARTDSRSFVLRLRHR